MFKVCWKKSWTNNSKLIWHENFIFMIFPSKTIQKPRKMHKKLLKKNLVTIKPLDNCVEPSLKDGWLSGISDGEGCFTCSLLSNSTSFRYRYILTQKWEANKCVFEHLLDKFKEYSILGSITPHNTNNLWELRVNGLQNCKGLFIYFDNYNLISKKKIII